ncbi:leucine rich repeat [Seminavis robusta]|uniref:Leucine rich repeat n=1 Tax=Seminavis robusta TaxID=568900 RepID=A0A9N8ER87_9STRA|nr:leucine rich repeat [Seminavis robusta]|eukprot:Sro1558_g282320.1 leucine rich repeat (435) ;mRNA; f:3396-4950
MAEDDNNNTKRKEPDDDEIQKLLSLRNIPSDIADLTALTKLDLPDCKLTSLPSSLPDALPNLSILFLSKNEFTEVPPVIGACKNLQMVAFKGNKLKSIHPDALQPQMRWLILTDNQIEFLPDTIGRCTKLQKFMLSGNHLTQLPDAISKCTNLELIRLSSNRLEKPPMKLLELPNLCWVAVSGNPFIQNAPLAAEAMKLKLPTIDDIPEGEGEVLGKGAGGITRKVTRSSNNQVVAVKTYVGAMTSDGSPEEERRMALTVANKVPDNDFLIALRGETKESGSLVMEYLDNYHALAGPPSLESCSRDVYSCPHDYMAETQAVSMVTGLFDVLTQLHAHGICHGDFYAHNILVCKDDRNKVKLSDFGAAFFYDSTADYGRMLQRTELRAFGHFAKEVQELFVKSDEKDKLEKLVQACREDSASFAQVNKLWKELLN